MTGPSDGLDDEGADPLESLLRHPVGLLPPRPGAFEQIRRTAARRRRTRAGAGAALALAVVTGSFLVAGALRPGGSVHVPESTTPPPAPTRSAASGTPAPGPPATAAPTRRAGGATPTASAPAALPSGRPTAVSGGASGGTPGTTAAGTPMCATAQLGVAVNGGDAGAGQIYTFLVFTNRGGTACHLTGFPGVSLLDSGGRQIGAPATHAPFSYRPVVLAPGGTASATLHTVNRQTNNPGECLATSTDLRVYPPGNTAAVVVPGTVTNCDNTFTVTPLAPGSTGNPPG